MHIGYLQTNDLNFSNDVILIPTGDGCAVNFTFDGLHNLHLKYAEILMKKIDEFNNSSPSCEKFNLNGWCNCHNKFNVRIGISEGNGLIYKDVNDNYNVGGNVINMAARLLSIARRNQILLNEEAYKQIVDLEEDPNFSDKFIKLKDIEIKHGLSIDVYIFNPGISYINADIPERVLKLEKLTNFAEKMNSFGISLPIDFAINKNEVASELASSVDMMKSMMDALVEFIVPQIEEEENQLLPNAEKKVENSDKKRRVRRKKT